MNLKKFLVNDSVTIADAGPGVRASANSTTIADIAKYPLLIGSEPAKKKKKRKKKGLLGNSLEENIIDKIDLFLNEEKEDPDFDVKAKRYKTAQVKKSGEFVSFGDYDAKKKKFLVKKTAGKDQHMVGQWISKDEFHNFVL